MKFSWGHGVIVFLVLFFTWMVSFVMFSLKQNNDLVTKDYYKQGAEFSNHMEIQKRSYSLKDSVLIKNQEGHVLFAFAEVCPELKGEKQIYFYRASDKKDDLKLDVPAGDAQFLVDKSQLKHGRYNVTVSWEYNQEPYEVTKDFFVR